MKDRFNNLKSSFLHYFSFVVALGVLFVAALMLFGVIEVVHKGRVILLVVLAAFMIYVSMRPPKD